MKSYLIWVILDVGRQLVTTCLYLDINIQHNIQQINQATSCNTEQTCNITHYRISFYKNSANIQLKPFTAYSVVCAVYIQNMLFIQRRYLLIF